MSNADINRELTVLERMFAIQTGKLLQKPHISLPKEDNVRATGISARTKLIK